jgi:acylglycerol lipase
LLVEDWPTMHHDEATFTAYDGTTIYHQSWVPDGEAAADVKAIVLVVHGLGEHSGRYQHVAETLVDAGYAVAALDHRGHGKSSGKRVFVKSYDEFMRDLTQFRRLVETEHPGTPLVVLGHSMGGNLAMGHVLANQDDVAALALSGALLKVGDDVSPVQRKALQAVATVAPGVRPLGLPADAVSRDPDVVQRYVDDPLVHTGKITAGLIAALFGAIDGFAARYPDLSLPIWIGHGTDDQLVEVAGSRQLEAAAVNADVEVHYYDGLYHEIFNEPEHDIVLADLVAWLDRTIDVDV